MKSSIEITSSEWKVMEYLWQSAPATGREVSACMEERVGWSRSTTLTLLRRLEAKSAIKGQSDGGAKTYIPLITRDEAALRETEDFISRVYNGSVSMLLASFTKKQKLSKAEIDEMYALLSKLETEKEED